MGSLLQAVPLISMAAVVQRYLFIFTERFQTESESDEKPYNTRWLVIMYIMFFFNGGYIIAILIYTVLPYYGVFSMEGTS